MKVTRVSVTQRHIDDGKACQASDCPIALAVLEALTAQTGTPWGVRVDTGFVCATALTVGRFRAELDSRARDFIEDFDDGARDEGAVTPFELELTWQELTP